MTKQDFLDAYRGRFLLMMTEAWACRRESPSALGLLMDRHALEVRQLLADVYEALAPKEEAYPTTPQKPPPQNGVARPRIHSQP